MEDSINIKKLTEEFHDAQAAEKKYKQENDAKFRAVNQKVASYEEFRDIVAASGLNPLDRKDIYSSEKVQTNWNLMYNDSGKKYDTKIVKDGNHDQNKYTNITTCSMFLKVWKSFKTTSEKKDFLFKFNELQLSKIFEKDLPSNIFEDTIEIIHEDFTESDISVYTELFEGFSKSSRINLANRFLDKRMKNKLIEIFDKINTFDSTLLVHIQEKYI